MSQDQKSLFALLEQDFESFRQQEIIFLILNLFAIAGLFLANLLLAPYMGNLSLFLIAALVLGFSFHASALIWLKFRSKSMGPRGILFFTLASIGINAVLTIVAASGNQGDNQYFVLMIVPILEAAFRFSFLGTLAVVLFADFLNFYWVWQFYHHLVSSAMNEYIEAGTISAIYTIVGTLVWLLVGRLRAKEINLSNNLLELEQARRRLLEEGKLAAVGRLASAIAHEIRNPVAMISSSLAMAVRDTETAQTRHEMFDIATQETARLERLITDFLDYAHPRAVSKSTSSVADTLHYVASACRAFASERGVRLEVSVPAELNAEMDPPQIQQAVMNLVKNAIQASPLGEVVHIRGFSGMNGSVRLEVQNVGEAISKKDLDFMFEPFVTKKIGGAGLGLAITRNICRSHGGDVSLAANQPDNICFLIELPVCIKGNLLVQEKSWAGF